MQTTTISNLRARMKHYFDQVTEASDVLLVPRGGKDDDDAVVIISLKEYNALKETEYLLSTEANRNRLAESIRQAETGETKPFDVTL